MAMHHTPDHLKLFYALFSAVNRTSKFAPCASIGTGGFLRRAMDARYLVVSTAGGKRVIDAASALGAITVRDATRDTNRFTGMAPAAIPPYNPISVTRGGLYTSEDHAALLAEMYHYAGKLGLPTDAWGKAATDALVTPKCFVKMKLVREAILANLDDSADSTVGYFGELARDAAVAAAMKTLGYRTLHEAIWHPDDYTAGRALGLAMAANSGFDGIRITSARGFSSADVSGETGNNVVLFAPDMQPATGIVQVVSLHLVGVNPAGKLETTHFLPDKATGDFVESGSAAL